MKDIEDVVGLPKMHVEVKRVERLDLYGAMAQAISECGESKPMVAHRRNNTEWLITMRASDWFGLYREWEAGQ